MFFCRARNVVGVSLITESGDIDAIHLMGVAGLQVVFADGHDRGVFPWAYLRAIAEGQAMNHITAL